MWDLKFRPACPDPRGMVLVADGFWVDIYLLGTNPDVDGTSALGATIADGSSPPKIPALFGGNGAADYGSLTWYEASEVMAAYGKQLLDYAEFAVAAYGSAEASSVGADPVTVQHQAGRVSKWGVEQATGVMWIWGRQLGGPDSGTAWTASTEGRGSVNSQPNAALFGGDWVHAASTGSRCAAWNGAPSFSDSSVGARGRCDHYRSN